MNGIDEEISYIFIVKKQRKSARKRNDPCLNWLEFKKKKKMNSCGFHCRHGVDCNNFNTRLICKRFRTMMIKWSNKSEYFIRTKMTILPSNRWNELNDRKPPILSRIRSLKIQKPLILYRRRRDWRGEEVTTRENEWNSTIAMNNTATSFQLLRRVFFSFKRNSALFCRIVFLIKILLLVIVHLANHKYTIEWAN